MKKLFFVALCLALLVSCKKEMGKEETPVAASSDEKGVPVEFADAKYTEMGKQLLAAMSKGDMDAWMSNYADNAKYYWNSGDSLVGKPAVDKFWRDRRMNIIETISFENQIWLPVKVNELENVKTKGVWLLGWYKVTAKYKGAGTMTQWMHLLLHFDANDKIDQANHYLDMALVNAALKK